MKSMLSGPNKPYRIALILLLAVYAILLGQLLNTPYFWDELGVYSQAAFVQYDHHLSLLPSSVMPEYSRGHPLLSAFLFGTAFKVFGPHVWVAHSLSLLLALLVTFTTYRIGEKYYGGSTGLFAVVLLLAQPLFVAQSILLLPEMLLTLCMMVAIKAFMDGSKLWYFVFASLALLTKEAAVILPFVAIGAELVHRIMTQTKPIIRWRLWLFYLSPLLVFAAFLVIQKFQNGWFFFPLHASLISFSTPAILNKLTDYSRFVFVKQGRTVMTVVLALGALWLLVQQVRQRRMMLQEVSLPVITSLLLILGLLGFSVINFYMNRYMLGLFPALCLLVAIALASFPVPWWLKATVVVVAVCLSASRILSPDLDYDNDLGYLHLVNTQKAATHFLEDQHLSDAKICSDWMIWCGLARERDGYLTGNSFTSMVGDADEANYLCVYSFSDRDQYFPKKHGVELWKTFKDGNQEIDLYKVVPLVAK